ncbi:archaetidylserine synthase [Methanobrevibacter smithii]|uniref:archaetidylserine synthase n=1 Tax=Methanobrevibacter smithii TaxID=2173 RepID=UPI001C012C21|nr:archaetidylserine synthase [Methanobrevibacter smithii]MBT9658167.1 CDP-diacylglycerol--serine O-phosphatidyltransferase [Methanobrevibacter smithii]HJJ02625.1 archaetidylserine synthase [Methanobrevibacter smithii]
MKLESTKIQSFFAISDGISLMNMLCGFISILLAINHNFELSAILMIIAIMFDSVDGWVARKINRNDKLKFGQNIDSLSDAISFGAAPAVFLYTISSTIHHNLSILPAIISLLIVACGVLRLTRYNAIADYIQTHDFIGFPIPGIAIILATFYLSGLFNIYIALILMTIVSLLMISNVTYPKFDNLIIIGISVVLIVLIILPISLTLFGINIPALILLIFSLYYLLINLIKIN